jgi:hypothetical protein
MQVVINRPKFLFHLLVFLVLLKLMFGFGRASGLPVNGTEAKVRHRTRRVQFEGVLQKRFGFLRLIHGHKNFREADTRFGVIRLQLQGAGEMLVRFF